MVVYYSDNFIINEIQNGFTFNFYKDKTDVEGVMDYGFRIGMSPLSAKEFLFALYNAVGEHEQKHGEIKFDSKLLKKLVRETNHPIGFQFRPQ
ncbi:MAG: hypothetical protein Q7S08_02470 [bacterium]|nr:hypothetical protein [bacterium]